MRSFLTGFGIGYLLVRFRLLRWLLIVLAVPFALTAVTMLLTHPATFGLALLALALLAVEHLWPVLLLIVVIRGGVALYRRSHPLPPREETLEELREALGLNDC